MNLHSIHKRRGVDSLEIANQMGHQDLNMLKERYGHYTDEKLHESSKVWDFREDGWR